MARGVDAVAVVFSVRSLVVHAGLKVACFDTDVFSILSQSLGVFWIYVPLDTLLINHVDTRQRCSTTASLKRETVVQSGGRGS